MNIDFTVRVTAESAHSSPPEYTNEVPLYEGLSSRIWRYLAPGGYAGFVQVPDGQDHELEPAYFELADSGRLGIIFMVEPEPITNACDECGREYLIVANSEGDLWNEDGTPHRHNK